MFQLQHEAGLPLRSELPYTFALAMASYLAPAVT
jgi:hypothetical protein